MKNAWRQAVKRVVKREIARPAAAGCVCTIPRRFFATHFTRGIKANERAIMAVKDRLQAPCTVHEARARSKL